MLDQIFDTAESSISMIMRLIKRRYVNPRNTRQCSSSSSPDEKLGKAALRPGVGIRVDHIQDGFFPLTDHECIDERRA
jgi:hypothetical protein